ncbi:MAG: response regulator transcription factor [Ferruginibacter sp.]
MSIKVLYAEDELFLGKIVKESLESRGYEVKMESDGNKVLSHFSGFQPAVCILDIMLPNKDGFAIAEDIRNLNKQVPIIFLTAKSQTEDLVKGFRAGGNDYIRKPFSMEELIVRIENVLKTRSIGFTDQAEVIIGAFNFQTNHQLLKYNGEEKKLSFRETELLKILYLNRDKIIDRREILNLLWGNDNFFNSRNLDVYITKLRSYLKKDSSLQIITVKGVGYRFVVE